MKKIIRKVLPKVSSLFLFKKRNYSDISKKARFKKCHYLYCCRNTIRIGNSKFINCRFLIHGTNNVFIVGDDCLFNDVEFYIAENSSIVIKNGTRIFGHSHLASCEGKKIEIGNDCLVSSNVNIRNTDSHSVVDLNGNRINHAKDILVGDHVWICNNVSILKGSNIGNNSIVGSNSVVNKIFEQENVIICGSPATIKKDKITWIDKKL